MRKMVVSGLIALALMTGCGREDAQVTSIVAVSPMYDVQKVEVVVPRSLRISDADLLYPIADIVWTEEAPGDRHAQVAAILTEALTEATSRTNSDAAAAERDVNVRLELERFHALSRVARQLTGGVHNIIFTLSLIDPATGKPIAEPKRIETDLRAYGGARALAAKARGETERQRIILHLANLLRGELSEKSAETPVAP